ncbi:LuxR C-terminal-related transcriptional regulator [Salinicola endophyticus]|uniref:LuxR C-terminal-related transcriptional regulator n=1 Tax=Salinicola endophyticus TaxID=1949083 RepID=A0AB74UES6_9GAMM
MNTETTDIVLVTDCNSQSVLFLDYIHQKTGCRVSALNPQERFLMPEGRRALVLLDGDHVNEKDLLVWNTRAEENKAIVLSAFNVRDNKQVMELLIGIHLRGVFYRQDNLELICKGIVKLLEGELWISRPLSAMLIDFYRRQQVNTYRPVCGLTRRELEIVTLLVSGASNTEIAEKLFVSEHTVKSHLYNLFRKINVHNRIQATNWARQNLGTIPVMASRYANGRR